MTLPRLATITAGAILLGCATTRADDGFSDDDAIETVHPRWMSWVPDDVTLSQLSLPASHETMSRFKPSWDFLTFGIAGAITENHSLTLLQQLLSGIRGLDIRGQLEEDGSFEIYHGEVYQNATFEEVLAICNLFLDLHPTETILMWMGENGTAVPDDPPISYAQAVFNHVNDPELGRRVLRVDEVAGGNASNNPTMGEMRGKIVMIPIQAWNPGDIDPFFDGLNGDDNGDFEGNGTDAVDTAFEVPAKVEAVLGFCEVANADPGPTLYRNQTESGGAWFPDSTARDVNPALTRFLFGRRLENKTGIISLDFPGGELIDAIIAHNMKFAPNLVEMGPDFEWIVKSYAECLDVVRPGDAVERSRRIQSYCDYVIPGQHWSVVSSGSELGDDFGAVATNDEGSFQTLTGRNDGYTELVMGSPVVDSFVSESELANFMSLSLLTSLNGSSALARSIELRARLYQAFPGMSWNVAVQKVSNESDFGSNLDAGVSYQTMVGDEGYFWIHLAWAQKAFNSPPVIDVQLPDPVVENTSVPLVLDASGSFDPEGRPLSVRWDLDANNTWDTEFRNSLTEELPLPKEEEEYSFRIEVTDGFHTVTEKITFRVENDVPSFTMPAQTDLTQFNVGDPVTFAADVTFADEGDDDWTVTVDWGDGSIVETLPHTNKTFRLNHDYTRLGTFTVSVSVNDGLVTTTETTTVRVSDATGTERIESLTRTPSTPSIPEGTEVTFTARFYYPNYNLYRPFVRFLFDGLNTTDFTSAVVAKGNNFYEVTSSFTYDDNRPDNDPYNALLVISRPAGGLISRSEPIIVENRPPVVTAPDDVLASEGFTYEGTASFVDSPSDGPWTATIDYDGDGSPEETGLPVTGGVVPLRHRFTEAREHAVTITVTDKDGATSPPSTFSITPGDVLYGVIFNATPDTIEEGQAVTIEGSIFGSIPEDIQQVAVDWGDNSAVETLDVEIEPGEFPQLNFTASHLYLDDGRERPFTIEVRVRDDDGNNSVTRREVMVRNALPKVYLPEFVVVRSGEPLEMIAAIDDAGPNDLLFLTRARIGDGPWKNFGWNGDEVTVELDFPSDGIYEVTVSAMDEEAGVGLQTTQVLVGMPPVEIVRSAPGFVELRWPTTLAPLGLERSSDMRPDNWVDLPDEPQVLNDKNLLQYPIEESRQFFRLTFP